MKRHIVRVYGSGHLATLCCGKTVLRSELQEYLSPLSDPCSVCVRKVRELPDVMDKQKIQRIKLRLQDNPVKLDATITEMAEDGSYIDVVFDGPIKNRRLYVFTDKYLSEKPPDDTRLEMRGFNPPKLWEVV